MSPLNEILFVSSTGIAALIGGLIVIFIALVLILLISMCIRNRSSRNGNPNASSEDFEMKAGNENLLQNEEIEELCS